MKKVNYLLLSALALVGMAGCGEKILPKYSVNFSFADGRVISNILVEEGQVPVFVGDDPVFEGEEGVAYTFKGWDRELAPVTEPTTYYAQFDQEDLFYVGFVDSDGTEIAHQYLSAGAAITKPADPSKQSGDAEFAYDFVGWSTSYGGELVEVAEKASVSVTYIANYELNRVAWSAEEKALMVEFMDEEAPVFNTKADFPWYYDAKYDCISVESWEDAGDIAAIFEEAGYEYSDASECYVKELANYEGWFIIASIYDDYDYVDEGEDVTTYVDLYVEQQEPATLDAIMEDILYYVFGIDEPEYGEDYLDDGEGGYWTAFSFGAGTEEDLVPFMEEVFEYMPGYLSVLIEPELSTLTTGDVCASGVLYTQSFNIVDCLAYINGGKLIFQVAVYSYF